MYMVIWRNHLLIYERKAHAKKNVIPTTAIGAERELKKMQEEEGNKDDSNFIKSNKQHGVIPLAISLTSLILFTYIEKNCWKEILKHLHIDDIYILKGIT